MNEDERRRAIEVGQPLYTEFGDAAAQPRLELWLRRGRLQTTGSHAGFVGSMEIRRMDAQGFGGPGYDGNNYYAARFWQPTQYWGAQAAAWSPNSTGRVDVGTLQSVRKDTPSDAEKPAPDANQH
jgi:hypothetical protein